MQKIKTFISTTFLGGTLVVLPIVVLIFLIRWLYNIVVDYVKPVTDIIMETGKINEFIAGLLAVVIILGVFFSFGLLIRTSIGNILLSFFDEKILKHIPFYKLIKETIVQLFGSKKSLFMGVALVKLFNNDTLMTALITDEHEDGSYTVFVPSGPAPTAGFVYHVKGNNVHKIDYSVEQAMRSIISLGAGSKQLLSKFNAQNKQDESVEE